MCLIHGDIVEVDNPTGNGARAVCDRIHLDVVLVLAWFWALQPNACYLSMHYPRQSHEANEHYVDKKRGSTRVHVGHHPWENVLAPAWRSQGSNWVLLQKVRTNVPRSRASSLGESRGESRTSQKRTGFAPIVAHKVNIALAACEKQFLGGLL